MAAGEGCGATGNRAMLGLVERRWRAGLLGDGEPATWGRGTGLRPGRRFLPNFDKFDRTLLNFNRTLSNFDRIFKNSTRLKPLILPNFPTIDIMVWKGNQPPKYLLEDRCVSILNEN
jgi:hypothetical protein